MRKVIAGVRRWALDIQGPVGTIVMRAGIAFLAIVSAMASIPFRVLAQAADLGLYIMDEFEYWSESQ